MIIIISIIFILIVTEIVYFSFLIKELKVNEYFGNFIGAKILSILIGFFSWLLLIGVPLGIKEEKGFTYLQVFGWFYGVILAILIFFGVNWLITKHLDNKKKK